MERNRIVVYSAMLLLAAGGSVSGPAPDFPVHLPDEVAGWTTSGEDRIYTPDNLFEYIDGGAELYLSYGVSAVFSRKYIRPGGPDIAVDVFDMTSSEDAFGVFSHSRETIDSTFGQGSQYTKGLLLFWKDRFYVSILASPESEASRAATFELARGIDAAIPRIGPVPGVLRFLPGDSLVEGSIRYFHHYVWLNSYYFIADANILHIDENTEAVLAKYGTPEKRWYVLIVEYPSDMEARLARTEFVEKYLPEMDTKPVVEIEDSTWTGCRGSGSVLAVVLNAPSKEVALRCLDDAEAKIESIEIERGGVEDRRDHGGRHE